MSSAIAAAPRRVWRALTTSSECLSWHENLLSAIDATDTFPTVGETVRWRYRLGSVPIVMRVEPIEVERKRRLRSKVNLGPLKFDQTFTLAVERDPDADWSSAKTVLGMKMIASNSAPLLGSILDRFEIRRITAYQMDVTLRAITKWCEDDA